MTYPKFIMRSTIALGVAWCFVAGSIHDVVVKNLTVTHVINDAFALTVGRTPESKVRRILFQDIKAIEACDDGLSAHGDCEVRVEGLLCDDCSTGIASTGTSVNDRVVTRNIHGFDLLFGEGHHVVTNSNIEGRGASAGISVEAWSKTPGEDRCALELENVVIGGPRREAEHPGRIIVNGAHVALEFTHATIQGMSLLSKNGGSLKLNDSVVIGGERCQIEVLPDSQWQANRNLYDLGLMRIGGMAYSSKEFAACQKATGQDAVSLWRALDSMETLRGGNRPQIGGKVVGADVKPIPQASNFITDQIP